MDINEGIKKNRELIDYGWACCNQGMQIGVYGCASAQEEVSGKGCIPLSNAISPDIALCIDVGFSTDIPGMPENKYGSMWLGKGVAICHSTDNNPELVEMLKNTASDCAIDFQPYVTPSPTGGTNTCKIQIQGAGIRTALLAIPNRYMHTAIEMCDLHDADAAIELLTNVIININKRMGF